MKLQKQRQNDDFFGIKKTTGLIAPEKSSFWR